MTTLERALEIAHAAHAGQVDKAGRPYIEHVLRVVDAVESEDARMDPVKVIEREWTKGSHTYYQAKARSRSGRVYEQTIADSPWGPSRGSVHEAVRAAAELDVADLARLKHLDA